MASMLDKKYYANGTPVYDLTGDRLTYYYKNGKLKAEGKYINDKMEGEWLFYRETNQLWQVGKFKDGMKGGWLWRLCSATDVPFTKIPPQDSTEDSTEGSEDSYFRNGESSESSGEVESSGMEIL